MFRHIVLFRWTDEATADQQRAALDGVRALPSTIPEIRDLTVVVDAGLAEGNYDAGAIVDFDDAAAYRRYAEHPDHTGLIAEHIRPITAARAALQHDIDE